MTYEGLHSFFYNRVLNFKMSNILIIAKGSYGGILPLYALGQELQKRGHHVTAATFSTQKNTVLSLGFSSIVFDKPSLLSKPHSLKALRFQTAVLLNAAHQADIIIGSYSVLLGRLIAKQAGKPWIYAPSFPLAVCSRYEPCLFPELQMIQRSTALYWPQLQKLYFSIFYYASYLVKVPAVLYQLSLDKAYYKHPLFEGKYSSDLNLLLTSPILVQPQKDWPKSTIVCGFSWFEPSFLGASENLTTLNSFITAGSSPIVFTLGAGSRNNPVAFCQESIRACQKLNVRGIIVAAKKFHAELKSSSEILVTDWLPYDKVFPYAKAVVHSGGIGTIGLCLKYGVPSLLIPVVADQFDNAYRANKLGVAKVIFSQRYQAEEMARLLSELLNDDAKKIQLEKISRKVREENGAQIACDAIEMFIAHLAK